MLCCCGRGCCGECRYCETVASLLWCVEVWIRHVVHVTIQGWNSCSMLKIIFKVTSFIVCAMIDVANKRQLYRSRKLIPISGAVVLLKCHSCCTSYRSFLKDCKYLRVHQYRCLVILMYGIVVVWRLRGVVVGWVGWIGWLVGCLIGC